MYSVDRASKDYVDRGVQTDYSLSHLSTPFCPSKATISEAVAHFTPQTRPCEASAGEWSPSHSKGESFYDAYSPSNALKSPGTVHFTTPTRPSAKTRQIPYNRPPVSKGPSTRIVSLPETELLNSTKATLEFTSRRLASMPERARPTVFPDTPPGLFGGSGFADISYFSTDENSRIIVGPRTSDVPHTPSPPSSPDSSVLIIENSVHLPDSFLRQKNSQNIDSVFTEDEGWITWANSPPRPIPALHGPLSLPYARCPSGAEGTIIEEPSNIPRMIWGLGTGEAVSNSPAPPTTDPREGLIRPASQATPNIPPRLQSAPLSPINLNFSEDRVMAPDRPLHLAMTGSDLQARTSHLRALENLGSRPAYNKSESMVREGNMLDHFYSNAHRSDHLRTRDLHAYNMDDERFLDWQSSLAHRALQNSILGSEYEASRNGFLKVSSSSSNGQSAQNSYPRIFVEPRVNENSKPAPTSRRMSALEIARRYRQQTLDPLLSVLPTPPSSSSTQWSSTFSPYTPHEEYLASPVSPASHTSQYQQFLANPPIRKVASNRNGNELDLNDSYSRSLSYESSFHDQVAGSGNSSSLSDVQSLYPLRNTTAYPGPPPTAPLPPLPTTASKNVRTVSALPSPKSPEHHVRKLSHQQPRSIPSTRLIQRRLSSVPEEDLFSELVRSDLTNHARNQARLHQTRTPSPVHVNLNPQSKGGDAVANEKHQAKVKLPAKLHEIGHRASKCDNTLEQNASARKSGVSRGSNSRKRGRVTTLRTV